MRLEVVVSQDVRTEYRHLWAMIIRGFDSSKHCLPCFIGTRIPWVRPNMVEPGQRDAVFDLEIAAGELFYICGVSHSFKHSQNLHIAGVVREGEISSEMTANRRKIEVRGLSRMLIDPEPARRLFPDRGREYLACRNFQFGCQVFGKSGFGSKVMRRQPTLF